ncbi:MAG: flippase [Candidatus Omnitrophica bacterium]|jgi:O-antigen/teichoic acid export membrane protein|nr:flippase [Candidatus Omnitrophota bacterium]
MSIARKIARNSGAIIAGYIAENILNFALFVSLARYFGKDGFGKISFLAVFFFFFSSTDNLLIRPILVREMSRDKGNSPVIIGNGLIIRLLFAFVSVIALWIAVWAARSPFDVVQLAFFTSISLIMASLGSSYETIFEVNFRIWYFKLISLIILAATLLGLYIVIYLKAGLLHFYVLSLILSFAAFGFIRHYAGKLIRPEFRIDLKLWKLIFQESWPLLLTALFIFIYHRIDQVLLLRFRGAQEVGAYAAAVKLAEMLSIIPVALKVSILPLMSAYFRDCPEKITRIYRASFKYLLFLIIPLAVWGSIFSGRIISLIYGAEFAASGPALSILIWAEVFVFIGVVNNAILIATNKQILDPVFTGTSAAVNLILNLVLIPKYGFVGAAAGSLFSYAVGPVMGYFIKTTRPYSGSMLYYSLRPLCGSLVMFLCVYPLREMFWISVLVSPVIYLPVMYIIKGIDKEDVRMIRSLIPAFNKYAE